MVANDVPSHFRGDFSCFQPVFYKDFGVTPLVASKYPSPSASILRVHDQGQHTRWALVGSEWLDVVDEILEIYHIFILPRLSFFDAEAVFFLFQKNPSQICWFLWPSKVCNLGISKSLCILPLLHCLIGPQIMDEGIETCKDCYK